MKILHDSLVVLHYEMSKDETVIYSLNTGKKVAGLPEFCFPDIHEEYLYWVDYSNNVNRYDLVNFKPMQQLTYLEKVKGYLKEDMFEMSDDNKRIAVVFNSENKKKGLVAVFDLTTGKLLSKLKGFNSFDEESEVTYNKKDVLFMDLNKDGSKIIIGNNRLIQLFDVKTGKLIAKFEEDQKFQRENFTECYFSPDYKTIFISSSLRLYFMNPDNLALIENVASGQVGTGNKKDKHMGTILKTEEYFDEYFMWHNMDVSEDGKYLYSLCVPNEGNKLDHDNYVW
ncbi:MAG: YncE family protein, partial [Bacteroidia bacterium]